MHNTLRKATPEPAHSSGYDMEKNNDGGLLNRSRSVPTYTPNLPPPSELIATDAFLGRLGGGQRFALDRTGTGVPSAPADAVRDPPWSSILSLSDFRKPRIWKLAFVEGIGTAIQIYISGVLSIGVLPTISETSVGAVFPVILVSIYQIFLISIFIYAVGPVTGAHFNPLITLGTFTAKLSSLPRTFLYVGFQCAGSVVGSFLVRASLDIGKEQMKIIPGCYIDSSIVTPGSAYAFESTMCFFQIFLAFGLGLDPRNETAFGPSLAPTLIGISSAMVLFAGSFARKGYLGVALNPARCLGLMAAGDRFTYHWVHWTGAITASVLNGLLYWFIPPYIKDPR